MDEDERAFRRLVIEGLKAVNETLLHLIETKKGLIEDGWVLPRYETPRDRAVPLPNAPDPSYTGMEAKTSIQTVGNRHQTRQ